MSLVPGSERSGIDLFFFVFGLGRAGNVKEIERDKEFVVCSMNCSLRLES